jgi:hypothetical protein
MMNFLHEALIRLIMLVIVTIHGVDGTTKLVSLASTKTRSQRQQICVIEIFQVIVKLKEAVDNLWHSQQAMGT